MLAPEEKGEEMRGGGGDEGREGMEVRGEGGWRRGENLGEMDRGLFRGGMSLEGGPRRDALQC